MKYLNINSDLSDITSPINSADSVFRTIEKYANRLSIFERKMSNKEKK